MTSLKHQLTLGGCGITARIACTRPMFKPGARHPLNILVLRGGALGDFILTLPLLQTIRENYPLSCIDLWASYPAATLSYPHLVDSIRDVNSAGLTPLFTRNSYKEFPELSHIDLAVTFLSDPEGIVMDNLTAAGVRLVAVGTSRMQPGRHASEQLADVLAGLGIQRQTFPDIPGMPGMSGARREKERLAFHIGSGSTEKNWPLSFWVNLVTQVKIRERLMICGEAETALCAKFQSAYKGPPVQYLAGA
ncbi:MAG: hypothetical protein JO076_11465, partial [Verrucomicrobia bacterium]|nr:hypothetical protein [Verrucomicrobiota bacterium]